MVRSGAYRGVENVESLVRVPLKRLSVFRTATFCVPWNSEGARYEDAHLHFRIPHVNKWCNPNWRLRPIFCRKEICVSRGRSSPTDDSHDRDGSPRFRSPIYFPFLNCYGTSFQ